MSPRSVTNGPTTQSQGVVNPRVAQLLRKDMPRMQPAALKHEYLTTVANVLRNPIAHEREEHTGTVHAIGFGDVHRTLPISIIVESTGSVRHAFVPSTREPQQKRLLKALQEHEDQWATERGATPRDIIGQIAHRGRDDVNRHGINRYEGGPPFTKDDLDEIASGKWYPTEPLPAHLEINHPGPIELHSGYDGAKIAANLSVSATMARGRAKDRSRLRVALDREQTRRPKLAQLTVVTDPVPEDEDEFEY